MAPKKTSCRVCKDIFCCAECRYKHEIKSHAIAVQKLVKSNEQNKSDTSQNKGCDEFYLFCPICIKQPLILEQNLHKEILLHIELFHLPLRCQKCLKTYSKINDFKEFSKCVSQRHESVRSNKTFYADEASKVTATKTATPHHCITLQDSPSCRQDSNEIHITPISIINMRWKARSKLHQEEFISDSVSSIKNLSSISNSSSRQSTGIASAAKGKVVRCSSTPVQVEMAFSKPKEQTFNATSSHMSSIQYNSGCESDISPAFSQPNSQALEPVNRYIKIAGSRPRMTAVTPLRQVMSKSIQKAFAEHGLPRPNTRKISYTFRKNMFDSNSSPEIDDQRSPIYPALDLRLSPAVRRSRNEIGESASTQNYNKKECNQPSYLRHGILLSAQKLTTESIFITHTEHLSSVSSCTSTGISDFNVNSVKHPKSTNFQYEPAGCNSTGNSVFKSCSSLEIITSTTEEIHSFDNEIVENSSMQPNTPITRIHGSSINKKFIQFETPKVKLSHSQQSPSTPNDEFFTPNSTPMPYKIDTESAETRKRKHSIKHNLNGTFSTFQTASIQECAHSTAISRIENVSRAIDGFQEKRDEDDEAFVSLRPEISSQASNFDKNEDHARKPGRLWSIMASVMRLPSLKGKTPKETTKTEAYSSTDTSSNSLIRRCASIAGSLVRSKSLVDENELCSLKRKRTYTTDNQSVSSYLTELNSKEASTVATDLNKSSKRFRIQGRRPIDRMRINS